MSSWEKYKQDYILFLEAGYIAVNQADEDAAIKLFKASETLRPDVILSKIGMGYLHLHKLDLKQACKIFEEVLEKEPNNEMAKALLGISMSLAPASLEKGEKILEQVHHSKDPMVKRLAGTAIDFAEQFLKKSPTPVQGEKRTK